MTISLRTGLPLAILSATLLAQHGFASGILAASYSPSTTFTDALSAHPAGLAFDGVNYWGVSGGSSSGVREAEYTATGVLVNTFSPGLDFRAIFTSGGNVFASTFSSSQIYEQTSPGTFTPFLSLTGGNLNGQSEILLNSNGTEYDGIDNTAGVVDRWSLAGAFLSTVTLSGYGSQGSEGSYPENTRFAQAAGYFFTYDGAGTLSAWNASGTRVGTTTLNGAGTSFDSNFSISYTNSQFWIDTVGGGTWDGYNLGLSSSTPEPATFGICLLGLAAFAGTRVIRKR